MELIYLMLRMWELIKNEKNSLFIKFKENCRLGCDKNLCRDRN